MQTKERPAVEAGRVKGFDVPNYSGAIDQFKGANSAASQRARILDWLLTRVQELREAGHNIVTHWDYEETQRGRSHRVGRYVLLADQGGQVNG